jgi:hypothetical protein
MVIVPIKAESSNLVKTKYEPLTGKSGSPIYWLIFVEERMGTKTEGANRVA